MRIIIIIIRDQKSKTEINFKLKHKFKSLRNKVTVFLVTKKLSNIMRNVKMKPNIKYVFFFILVAVSPVFPLTINITLLNYAL